MRGRGRRPATPKRRAEGTIRRIAVSSACGLNSHVRISTLLSIPQALSLQFIRILPSAHGRFRALHRNIAVSEWGAFLALHPNIALSAWALSRTSSKYRAQQRALIRSIPEHDVTLSETELRAAQPNLHRGRIFAHACKSRRAPRPRKLDGKLSRHGLGARRVALLAPRGVFNRYRYPLSYVGAITKIFSKAQK